MTEVTTTEPKTIRMPAAEAVPEPVPALDPNRRVGPPPPGELPALFVDHAT